MKRMDFSPDSRVNFAHSLRSHPRLDRPMVYNGYAPDYFKIGQLKLPKIETERTRQMKKKQDDLLARLLSPEKSPKYFKTEASTARNLTLGEQCKNVRSLHSLPGQS
eukprot:TRINITY_DN3828_c0_g1_i2.p1 TRINITY_DN3828_c0_g1~~TRINITY_DN3828_c0_g1_i2.p1  ORF type:complete len:107 (-),score=3.84 TRINITY_DN3828_c0_g1_i2:234-554(-)